MKEAFEFMAKRERDWQLFCFNYDKTNNICTILKEELDKVPKTQLQKHLKGVNILYYEPNIFTLGLYRLFGCDA